MARNKQESKTSQKVLAVAGAAMASIAAVAGGMQLYSTGFTNGQDSVIIPEQPNVEAIELAAYQAGVESVNLTCEPTVIVCPLTLSS